MKRGFTLLEVLIAMAILAIAMTVLVGTQSRSVVQTNHAQMLVIVSGLARDQMYAIETQLQTDGFVLDTQRERGNFRDAGFPDIRWEARIEPIDMQPEDLATQLQGQLFGGTEDGGALSGSTAVSQQLPQMLGFLPMMLQQLSEQRIRQVFLRVSWQDLRGSHDFDVQQFIVMFELPTQPVGGPGGNVVVPGMPPGVPAR